MKKRVELDEAPVTLGEALGIAAPGLAQGPGEPSESKIPHEEKPPRRAVLQRARAGGGKWVVRVLLTPAPSSPQLEGLMREARKALGTGARIEGGSLAIQGDIPDRVEEWLRRRGIEKIVR